MDSPYRRSVHEAGHAVAACHLGGFRVCRLSIEPSGSLGGTCDIEFLPVEGESFPDACKRRMTQSYAGAIAEALFFNETPLDVWDMQQCDKNRVCKCVDALRSQGFSESVVKKCREDAWVEANRLLDQRRSAVETFTNQLCQKRTLTKPEVEEIAQGTDQKPSQNRQKR